MMNAEQIWDKVQNGVLVIAEIGKGFIQTEEERSVSEYLENAKALAKAAKDAGADVVKFQTHTVEDEQLNINVTAPHFKGADRYSWVTRNTNATPLEDFWKPLKQYCDEIGIPFFSTPMTRGAAQLLSEVGVDLWKVGSGDILDFVLLEYLASTGKPVLISSGMSTIEELDACVNFLKERNVRVAIFHCVSKYPCPLEELNLASISFLSERYNVPVGFSDHSIGIEQDLLAVALGAKLIEKHFSFDRTLWGSDHKVSMLPSEMKEMTEKIKLLKQDENEKKKLLESSEMKSSMGNPGKIMQEDEAQFRPYFRKSLMAGQDIPAGTTLTKEMIYAMRPQAYAGGLPSENYPRIVGMTTKAALKKYDPITEEALTSLQ